MSERDHQLCATEECPVCGETLGATHENERLWRERQAAERNIDFVLVLLRQVFNSLEPFGLETRKRQELMGKGMEP